MSAHDREGRFSPRGPTARHRPLGKRPLPRGTRAGKRDATDGLLPLTGVLDFAADCCRRGTLSAGACELILAWWIWPQLTAYDFIDLGIARPRVREAIAFLQAMPAPMRVLLPDVIPAAAKSNLSAGI